MGNLGAKWFNITVPYGFSDGKPKFFEESHITIVDSAPRHLLVKVKTTLVDTFIFVGHSPHRRSLALAKQWYANVV